MCNSTCIDPQTDNTYCGASAFCTGVTAGTTCSATQACVAGVCGPPPCTWTPLVAFDLATLPGEATTANGGAGGQSAQSVYGRTAWYQTSDWTMLMFPMHLASGDDVFAVQADLYLPAYTTCRRHATLALFNDPAPGSGGGTHGLFVNFTTEAASTSLNWWFYPTAWGTMDRTLTVPFTTNGWPTVRVEGRRSACAFRVLVDGTQVDASTKTCDTTGAKLTLGGNSAVTAPALIAWSNMSISKGTTTCVP